MDSTQTEVEALLREKARRRVPTLEYALKKLEFKIANQKALFPHDAHKIKDWKDLCAQYRADLKLIAEGHYHGYNGQPFGATPGITKRMIF